MAASNQDGQVHNLEQLLGRIREAEREHEQVSFGAILAHLGQRSFGPVMLLIGLITAAPIVGDIPGVPTLMGLLLVLTAGQMLFKRDHLWFPQWLLARSVSRDKVERSLEWVRRPARGVDRILRPRMQMLVTGVGAQAVALICVLIAASMPPMELVPLTANGAGLALIAFGLGLIARDGLLSLLAFVVTVATFGATIYGLI